MKKREPIILVVEDEYFLADDLVRELKKAGVRVVGPASNIKDALDLLETIEHIDSAVLDINLRGEDVYPVAELLRSRGVSFVFATGYDATVLPERYSDIPRWNKPFDTVALVHSLTG